MGSQTKWYGEHYLGHCGLLPAVWGGIVAHTRGQYRARGSTVQAAVARELCVGRLGRVWTRRGYWDAPNRFGARLAFTAGLARGDLPVASAVVGGCGQLGCMWLYYL